MGFKALAVLLGWFLLGQVSAFAQVKLDGYFIAHDKCAAVQSIKKKTNPGSILLEPQKAYLIKGKNKPAASHYFIEVHGAKPKMRWVPVTCGQHVVPADGSGATALPDNNTAATRGGNGNPVVVDVDKGEVKVPAPTEAGPEYVLAISWQPGFCEIRPSKPECQSQNEFRFDATNFTLHGLWPQPRSNVFCGVSKKLQKLDKDRLWQSLPKLTLDEATREELSEKMPGVTSFLHRHEWIKHGTCYGSSEEEYYAESLDLLDQVNRSEVQALFEKRIGGFVSTNDIREAFDNAFGTGAGARVEVVCKTDDGRKIISELRLFISGFIEEGTPLGDLLIQSRNVKEGCSGGIVDAVGQQ